MVTDRSLPWWLSSKESTCSVGYLGSIPGSGRSLGEGNGCPLQYSSLENPMDRGAWWATVRRVTKSQTWLKKLITHTRNWERFSNRKGICHRINPGHDFDLVWPQIPILWRGSWLRWSPKVPAIVSQCHSLRAEYKKPTHQIKEVNDNSYRSIVLGLENYQEVTTKNLNE